jgi:hypothetical protein
MTAALLAALAPLLAALAPLLANWLTKRMANQDDPRTIIEQEKDENRTAIQSGTAGELLEHRLDRLPPHSSQSPGP